MALQKGNRAKVRHIEGLTKYTLDVEVTGINPPNGYEGRVEAVFAAGEPVKGGEITGGDILRRLPRPADYLCGFGHYRQA